MTCMLFAFVENLYVPIYMCTIISVVKCGSAPEDFFTFANSVDYDEMTAAFHPELHCLPKYQFMSFQ